MSLAVRFSVMRRFVFGNIGLCALAIAGSVPFAGQAQAAPITQTLTFEVTDFFNLGSSGISPPFSTVSGTVVLTYDDATTNDITGQAVDSVTFSTPTGVLETSTILFDLRLPPNVGFPQHQWEIDIYNPVAGSPVSVSDASDWLLYVVGVNPLGADFDNASVATQLLYSDGQFPNTGDIGVFASTTTVSVTGSSVPAGSGTPVPAPAALALLGLGLAGTGLMASRRQGRSRARTTRGLTPLPA